ncbi:MAG: SH3 domain-containing protein [Deltaproteobacteria bacterium]
MKLGATDLKETFTGSRVELDTPLGTTIPITFTGDGLMSGNAGSLASVLGAEHDRGRWWVKGDRLCYKWFRWFDAEEQCLTIHVKQERVFWRRDDGKRGTATIVERAPSIVVAEKPSALPPRAASRAPAVVVADAVEKPKVQAPVLKSPPRLAARPKSAAERLGIPEEAPADRSLFFVGLGLARTLQSQFAVASAEAAPVPRPKAKPASTKAPVMPPAPVQKSVAPSPRQSPPAASADPDFPPDDASPVETATAAPVSFSVYGVDDDDVLNMRSGPSEDYAIIGVIPPNATNVRMAGRCIATWCEIQFRNARGWVNRYYLAQN